MNGGAIRYLEKTVAQNNPIFARRKTDLKRGFVPKKAYAYKSPILALVSTNCACYATVQAPPQVLLRCASSSQKVHHTFWEPCSSRRLGLVPAAPSFRAAHSEQTTPRRNPIMRPHSRKWSTPYLKSMYGKRVQATFTPVLLHYIIPIFTSQLK